MSNQRDVQGGDGEQAVMYDFRLRAKEIELMRCATKKRFYVVLLGFVLLMTLILVAMALYALDIRDAGDRFLDLIGYTMLGGGGFGGGYLVKANGKLKRV